MSKAGILALTIGGALASANAVAHQDGNVHHWFEEQRTATDGGAIEVSSPTGTTTLPRMCRVFNIPGLDVVLWTAPCDSMVPRPATRTVGNVNGGTAAPADCLVEQLQRSDGSSASRPCDLPGRR